MMRYYCLKKIFQVNQTSSFKIASEIMNFFGHFLLKLSKLKDNRNIKITKTS